MTYDYWLAVGHVSAAARKDLDILGCMVRDVSRENPAIALVYSPFDSGSLTVGYDGGLGMHEMEGMKESELLVTVDVSFREKSFVWRVTWGDRPPYQSSITQTERITCDEWERQRALTARKAIIEGTIEK